MLHLETGMAWCIATILIALTLPLTLELLLVSVGAALSRRRSRPTTARVFSKIDRLMIVIPSHNEELMIQQCIRSLAASAGDVLDLLVVAHNCDDRTAEIAREEGAHVLVLNDSGFRGKGDALMAGFAAAAGEYKADAFLVVDSDTLVSPNLVAVVRDALESRLVVQCRYEVNILSQDAKDRLTRLSFFCKNVVRAAGRDHLGLSCGIFGNGFAFRKEVLDTVPYSARSIVEDLEFHLSLLDAGLSTRFVPDATVWADIPTSEEGIRSQSARWEGGRLQILLSRGPVLFRKILGGQWNLLEPLLDLAGLPIALQAVLLALLLLMPVDFSRWYAVAGISVLALHLLVALQLSASPLSNASALLYAPLFVVRKIAMAPAILLMARKDAPWVRTARVDTAKYEKKR